MDRTQKRVQVLLGRARLAEQKRLRNRSIGIAATLVLFGAILIALPFITGCSETYVSPTIACCSDTCDAVHTCDSGTGCTDDCANDTVVKVFEWVCHKGNSKKVYDWQVPKHLAHGDTRGKCVTPPGDDDDDDSGNKVCICHIPPGNPANAHTICISPNAVDAHITNHGDYLGECK
jgi:hypothetical protein